jgi:hypothetical protein
MWIAGMWVWVFHADPEVGCVMSRVRFRKRGEGWGGFGFCGQQADAPG